MLQSTHSMTEIDLEREGDWFIFFIFLFVILLFGFWSESHTFQSDL